MIKRTYFHWKVLCLVLLQVPKKFVTVQIFWARTKSLIAFSASSKTFVLAQKLNLRNENHLLVWNKMFVTSTICLSSFGLAQKIWKSHFILVDTPKKLLFSQSANMVRFRFTPFVLNGLTSRMLNLFHNSDFDFRSLKTLNTVSHWSKLLSLTFLTNAHSSSSCRWCVVWHFLEHIFSPQEFKQSIM